MYINVIVKFDLEQSLYEAKQRCNWFIDGYGLHGLTPELYNEMSTERLCELYNVDINYFKLENEKNRENID